MSKKNDLMELLLYLVVGGCATLSEWVLFYVFDKVLPHYMLSTVLAYILSTFVNWLLGRILVFKNSGKSLIREIFEVYLASVVGLLLNLLIMWVTVDFLFVNEMIAKMLSTAIVFIYNFLVRKLLIYKRNRA